jgi:hypothetical protein
VGFVHPAHDDGSTSLSSAMTLANSHFFSHRKAVTHIKTGCVIKKWICHTHDNQTRHHYYINKLVSTVDCTKAILKLAMPPLLHWQLKSLTGWTAICVPSELIYKFTKIQLN